MGISHVLTSLHAMVMSVIADATAQDQRFGPSSMGSMDEPFQSGEPEAMLKVA